MEEGVAGVLAAIPSSLKESSFLLHLAGWDPTFLPTSGHEAVFLIDGEELIDGAGFVDRQAGGVGFDDLYSLPLPGPESPPSCRPSSEGGPQCLQ